VNVRYWPMADIGLCTAHVCFWEDNSMNVRVALDWIARVTNGYDR